MSGQTPLEYYQNEIKASRIQEDAQQRPVIEKLDVMFWKLMAREKKGTKASLTRWFQTPPKGLYLWGSVGIGKTFLIDCFYHCLPIPKLRLHFHQFMLRIHQELKNIQGEKNPLAKIAKKISHETSVICFDEFFVANIADAMILGELFLHLFKNSVTLVASSNIPPDLLYKEGLQRERFLPTIALIKQYADVVHLHSKIDYRQRHIKQAGVYYTPLDAKATANLENAFIYFSRGAPADYKPICLYQRFIPVVKHAGSVIWFEFDAICGRPRSQNDYLEITKSYHTILIQQLRQIDSHENDLILSFMYLVDILYDAHCRLIIAADVPLEKIYIADKTNHPFDRTLSRLAEMQSESYVYPETIQNELTNL